MSYRKALLIALIAIALLSLAACGQKAHNKNFVLTHVTYSEKLPSFSPQESVQKALLQPNMSPADLWMGILPRTGLRLLQQHNLRGASASEMIAFNTQHPSMMINLSHVCAGFKGIPTQTTIIKTRFFGMDTGQKSVDSFYKYPQMSLGVRTGMASSSCDYSLVVEK